MSVLVGNHQDRFSDDVAHIFPGALTSTCALVFHFELNISRNENFLCYLLRGNKHGM